MKNKLRSGLASDEESRFASTLLTSLVRIWTSGIVHEARGVKGSGWSDSESNEFLENISTRILAFSTECVKVWPSFIKCGMDEVFAFSPFLQMTRSYYCLCYSQELSAATFVRIEIVTALIRRCIYFLLPCCSCSGVGFDVHSINASSLDLTASARVL